MKRPSPQEIEADRAAALLAAVHAYFKEPQAATAARVATVMSDLRQPPKDDFATHCRAACEHAARAVGSASDFGVPPSETILLISEAVAAGGEDLLYACRDMKDADKATEHIVRAKKNLARAEKLYAEARPKLASQPQVVAAMKTEDVLRQLSLAADSADQAAGILGGLLVK